MRDWEIPISKITPRTSRQSVKPTAIAPSALAQTVLVNTQAEIIGPLTLSNGGNISLTSIIANTANEKIRLGAAPYGVVFFEDSLSTGAIIGDSVTGYIVNGPMAMPKFTPNATSSDIGGSTGDNIVYLTELINDTGMEHDIYIITDTRVLTPIGGGAS